MQSLTEAILRAKVIKAKRGKKAWVSVLRMPDTKVAEAEANGA